MDYKKMKRKELKTECKKKGIKGYSKLKKDVLINLLENFPNIQEKYKKKIKKKKIKKKKIKKKN
jgi:hypothetical protein